LSIRENGKTKKIKDFVEPVFLSGRDGFTELIVWFDKQNERYYDYQLNGIESVNERNAYRLELSQKEVESGTIGNARWNTRYQGIAWVDIKTMDIIRISRDRLSVVFNARNRRPTRKHFTTQYEYDKIEIKDRFMMLPVEKTVEIFHDDGQLETLYKYRDHMAFTVDAKVSYGMTN